MKKVLGIIFLVIAAFFCVVLLGQIPTLVAVIIKGVSGNANDVGYMVGTILPFGVVGACIYFLIKYGVKWLKKIPPRKVQTDILDEDLMTNNLNNNQSN
jgi:hypothetical protein